MSNFLRAVTGLRKGAESQGLAQPSFAVEPSFAFEQNAKLTKLAAEIVQRLAKASDENDLEWLIADELFERGDAEVFIKEGGLFWTALRALSTGDGRYQLFYANAHLGVRIARLMPNGEPEDAQSLQEILYGRSVSRGVQDALYGMFEAALCVLTLLERESDLSTRAREAMWLHTNSGSRKHLALLYAIALDNEIELDQGFVAFLHGNVEPLDLERDAEKSRLDDQAIARYLKRSM